MTAYERLLQHGIKPSVQRLSIMTYLMEHPVHPSAEDIYVALSAGMPTLSKTTVYNTLRLFSEAGAAQMLTIDDRNANFDADVSAHAHFLCKRCGHIYDLPADMRPPSVACNEADGHRAEETHLYYKGVCKHCLATER